MGLDEFIYTYMREYAIWLIMIYGGVFLSMLIDLISGLRKARLLGQKRTSRGYKRTCDKAMRYFLPMSCLTIIDIIVSALSPLPVMTMVMGIYNIFCEIKSIMESTHDKQEIERYATLVNMLLSDHERYGKLIETIFDLEKKTKELNNYKKQFDNKNQGGQNYEND